MDNNNSDFNLSGDANLEANGPTNEAEQSIGSTDKMSMMKDFGRKGLGPILEVFTKHQGDLNPYVQSIDKAFSAAITALNAEGATEADRTIGSWVTQASTWMMSASDKLKSTNPKDLLNFLEEEARARPGLMFSVSYVAGLLFGRVGRHVGSQMTGSRVTSSPKEFQDSPNIH